MALYSLATRRLEDSFQFVTQVSQSATSPDMWVFADGLGNPVYWFDGTASVAISASYAASAAYSLTTKAAGIEWDIQLNSASAIDGILGVATLGRGYYNFDYGSWTFGTRKSNYNNTSIGSWSFAANKDNFVAGDYATGNGYLTMAVDAADNTEGYNTATVNNTVTSLNLNFTYSASNSTLYSLQPGNYTASLNAFDLTNTSLKKWFANAGDSNLYEITLLSASYNAGTNITEISCSYAGDEDQTGNGIVYFQSFSSVLKGEPLANHAEGDSTIASGDASHAEGKLTQATSVGSHAEGLNTIANSSGSHAEGRNTIASADSAHAEGSDTIASGYASHAGGYSTIASGNNSTARGFYTIASGDNSFVFGYQSKASGSRTLAFGTSTLAIGVGSVTYGTGSVALGPYTKASGQNTIADGTGSNAEGLNTQTLGLYTHAEGSGSVASGRWTHAEGQLTVASNTASHAEGYNAAAIGKYSHAEGYNTIASGHYAHAEGESTLATGTSSHAEGALTTASGQYNAHAEGYSTHASGAHAHSEGFRTLASGLYAHSEGSMTFALGQSSHVEGTSGSSYGFGSHAEGLATISSGSYSHAEGSGSISIGPLSHAEGTYTIASGEGAHAEGKYTFASGAYSHAEGYYSTASGYYAHAEGSYTYAIGNNSIAGGSRSIAVTANSVALGLFTIASGAFDNPQTAVGRYNKHGNSDDVFVVGVGSDNVTRLDGFGISNTKMYASNSIYFPNLANISKPYMVVYEPTTGQLFYAATSSGGGGGSAISFISNSTTLTSALTSLVITGSGWSATNVGGQVTLSFAGGGSTSPGGSNTQIQYNNSGVFGGVSTLTWDGTTLRATGSFTGSLVGSLTGTASFAVSASRAVTASYVPIGTGLSYVGGLLTNNLSIGVTGGQSAIGGTAASNNLTLSSTTNATKGKILWGTTAAYDEANIRLGIGTASPSYTLHVTGAEANPVAYFDSSYASTRVGINNASNTGFGLYVGGALKWSVGSVNVTGTAGTNPELFFYNDQRSQLAWYVDGNNERACFSPTWISPSAKLHINAVSEQALQVSSTLSTSTAWAALIDANSGAQGLKISTNGNAQYLARASGVSTKELRFQQYSDGNAYFGTVILSGGTATSNLYIRTTHDSGGTNSGNIYFSPNNTQNMLVASTGVIISPAGTTKLTMNSTRMIFEDGWAIRFGTSTGTKIGDDPGQYLSFWGVSPITQPTSPDQMILVDATGGTPEPSGKVVDTGDTNINDNFATVLVLVNELRNSLVNTGLILGS